MDTEFVIQSAIVKHIEQALLINGRTYVKELARILKVDERTLLKRVIPSIDTVKQHVYITSTSQCTAYTMCEDIVTFCRNPVFCGKPFCGQHLINRFNLIENTKTKHVIKVADSPDREPLWIRGETDVINNVGNIIGSWNATNYKLTLFTIL